MIDPRLNSNALTFAAMLDMIARGKAVQAEIIRGATEAEIEAMRLEAMACAEAYFDHAIESGRLTRAMIADHPERDALGEAGAKRLRD